MLETLFAFLFKYRPVVFQEGELALAGSWPRPVLVAILVLAAGVAVLSYKTARGKSRPIDRVVLGGLRVAVVGLVVFCLFRPVLVLTAVQPQRNFLGVLIDDSRSMQVADVDGRPRSQFVADAFGPEGALGQALAERFSVRMFRFSSSTERIEQVSTLDYSGTRTALAQAFERARDELAGVPLSGLVVVTDGADNGEGLGDTLLSLQASGIPIFPVALGRDRLERDIQVGRVETPRRVLKGASLVVDVPVAHEGYEGQTITLNVEDEGRIVGTQEVELPAGGVPAIARVHFTVTEPGPRLFRFRVPPQADEMVSENNHREAIITVEDRREKILYVEGEPRFEVKFLRRAVADDPNLQVAVLQRTAENKFLRLDVDDGDDLAGGFPKTREELFKYRGLVLGSVEASFFTPDQLRMIADFVSHRGGGLLTLGGRQAFGQGGYSGTPVADVQPVVLEPPAEGESDFFAEISVTPTRAGSLHPSTQVAADERQSAERWRTLPPLSTVNPITRAKPGATVLLTGRGAEMSGEQIVLAFQRYGAGKAMAFPVQDSWLWQMHADVAVDDLTHETLWRRLLRWLVDGVPGAIETETGNDQVEPNDTVLVRSRVLDGAFLGVNNASVVAHVTGPSGTSTDVPLHWTANRDGEYEASFPTDEEGLYEVRVAAERDGESLGESVTYVRSAPGDREFFDPAMRAPLLQRLADETGGRFYTPADVDSLAEDLQYVGGGITTTEQRDLWDMPAILFLLIGLVGGEWGYRRWRGLV